MNAKARTILVVDDDEAIRKALRRTLSREGYEVIVAEKPEDAFEYLRGRSIDLVISDQLMPRMTGLEFLKIVHDRHPHVLRIMLTGHADTQTAICAINQGEIYRFLVKPWDDTELKVTLHLAFEHLELERENRRLLALVRRQQKVVDTLERDHPDIFNVRRDENGAIVLEEPIAAKN
jgi:two-component system, probable response regulator PhcQ